MTAQAGWYEAPGETGMLRYWSGEAWTEHRQPAPPVGLPVVPAAASWSDQTAAAPALQPVYTPQPQFVSQPQFTPQFTPQPQFSAAPQFVPAPQFAPQSAGVGQLAPTGASMPGESKFQQLLGEARTAASNPANQGLAEELGGAALAADGAIGFGRNRQGIVGAVGGMGAGLVCVIVGFIIIAYVGSLGSVGAGEKEVSAVVTSLASSTSTDSNGNSTTSCTPLAKYSVGGSSYQATSNVGVSPCSYQVGQSVDVIYTVANPATAHVAISSSALSFLWFFPIVGGLVFLSSLWTFIKRAGSIAGGIALIVNGRKRRAAGLQHG